MENLRAILEHYGIIPQAIVKVTDRVHQIKANSKQYALKRSNLSSVEIEKWLSVYDIASQHRLYSILPLYLTRNQTLYVEMDDDFYYLSPWIEGNTLRFTKDELSHFMREIGKIHLQTKKSYRIKKETIEDSFQSYQKRCEEYNKHLLNRLEEFERIHYPSPFELQVLTHFRDVSDALKKSHTLVDKIISLVESDAEWGTSLVHGNLQRSHLFEQYIINWENASFKHANFDLVALFQNETAIRSGAGENMLASFPAYLEENPLGNLELSLLTLYLLNTTDYLSLVDAYLADPGRSISMVEQSIKLEKEVRKIVFGREFYHQLHAFETTIEVE